VFAYLTLFFNSFDHDKITADDALGEANFPLNQLVQGLELDTWLPLLKANKPRGQLHVGITAMNFGKPAGGAVTQVTQVVQGGPPGGYAPPPGGPAPGMGMGMGMGMGAPAPGYPAPGVAVSQTTVHSSPSPYGAPPAQPGYGYAPPPAQPGYGYAPSPGQPGYGYGAPPPAQPGYGAPPAQPGYGYAPPPAQPGYGYQQTTVVHGGPPRPAPVAVVHHQPAQVHVVHGGHRGGKYKGGKFKTKFKKFKVRLACENVCLGHQLIAVSPLLFGLTEIQKVQEVYVIAILYFLIKEITNTLFCFVFTSGQVQVQVVKSPCQNSLVLQY